LWAHFASDRLNDASTHDQAVLKVGVVGRFGSFGGIAGRIGAAILNRRRRKKGRIMETDQERAERHERERIESNERYETERKESGARAEQERKDAREIREHPEDHRSD
jgi:hypothetical protein